MYTYSKTRMTTYAVNTVVKFLFILYGLILIASQNVFANKPNDSACFVNGHWEKYESYYQICCNNKIQTRLQDQDCCAQREFFFQSKSLCCGKKVFDRYIVDCKNNNGKSGGKCSQHCSSNDVHLCSERICCGEEAVIKSETRCCHGNKINLTPEEKTDSDFFACCNETHLYDRRSEICCNKRIFPLNNDSSVYCCGDEAVSLKQKSCLRTIDAEGRPQYSIGNLFEAVCGDIIYNRLSHGCCNGIRHPEPEIVAQINTWKLNPEFRCCDHLLLKQGEKCCRQHHSHYFKTHPIPDQPELHCCGSGFYNASKELCNNGTLVPIQFDKARCGMGFEYYDPAKEECCGIEVYSRDKSHCCEGSVISNEKQCCNGQGIDHSYICCSDLPAKKSYFDSDKCCFNPDYTKAEAYSKKQGERCVDGSIIQGYPDNTEPCGPRGYFDPRNEICCNEMAINKFNQTCCFDEVFNLSANESSCCEVDGKVYRLNDPKNPCLAPCGSAYYDGAKQVCCKDKVYRAKRDFECCGSLYINITRKKCCGDRYSFKKLGNLKCCGKKTLYNYKSFNCNSEGLIESHPTSNLCKRGSGSQKTKAHSCNSTFGVSGRIDKVNVENTWQLNSMVLNINLSVRKWLGGSRSYQFNGQTSGQTLSFSIIINLAASRKCTQNLQPQANVMIFFDNEPAENKVTLPKVSKVFLMKYTDKLEQEMLTCRSKV